MIKFDYAWKSGYVYRRGSAPFRADSANGLIAPSEVSPTAAAALPSKGACAALCLRTKVKKTAFCVRVFSGSFQSMLIRVPPQSDVGGISPIFVQSVKGGCYMTRVVA